MELYDNTWLTWFPGLGQAVGLVKDSGIRFLNNHTPQAARNNISLTSGFFSKSTAQADIDAGRPIVLGMESIFSGATSFHVVPASDMLNLTEWTAFWFITDGEMELQVWVPSSWFGFQIRMSTTHTHSFVEGGNRNDTHRDLTCSVCGATSVDPLYNLSGGTISGVRHTLSGSVTIPNSINIYNTATASFVSQSIMTIGNNVFANQTQLSQISIPSSVTIIGQSAFKNCTGLNAVSLQSVKLSGNITNIDSHAGFEILAEKNIKTTPHKPFT